MMFEEVLSDLKKLSLKGPIKAVGQGSNAIGKTLQIELNIGHSTTSRNQYKGFVISSTSSKSNRTNLFAKVPDWEKSEIKSSKEMLDLYGVEDPKGKYIKKLFCSVNSLEPNNFGLIFVVDKFSKVLQEKYFDKEQKKSIAIWNTEQLFQKLMKLDKTIVVSANLFKKKDGNYFHFRFAEFMLEPSIENFFELLDYGAITMDHLISLKKGTNVRDQGPIFKISKNSKKDLFYDYQKFDLMD
tara:strand:- start:390 stop:1112 length:723 start_codon:yes stop_codon:yes gene_type:complete